MDNNIKADCSLTILVAIPCLGIGGTEIQTLILCNVLRSLGHDVEVICYFEHEDAIVLEFEKNGIKVSLLNLERKSGIISKVLAIRKEIKIKKGNTLHVQYMAPGALPIIAARLAGAKRVFATVHQPWTINHGRFSKIFLRIASLLCTKFIAVSVNAEKSWFGSGQLFENDKPLKQQPHHFTIHNSVDTDRISKIATDMNNDNLKKELSIPNGISVIGAVSRMTPEKGVDLIIEAFILLKKSKIKTHLLLVGAGPDYMKLKKTVTTYGINSYVTFYGEADWVRAMQLIAIMDIVVVPSRFEGFGLTAAEAMAAGKPVVASETFGLKEVVINEETGILFPVNDTLTLKIALEKLIDDPQKIEKLGNAGRERVREHFSLDLFSRKIKALYNF